MMIIGMLLLRMVFARGLFTRGVVVFLFFLLCFAGKGWMEENASEFFHLSSTLTLF